MFRDSEAQYLINGIRKGLRGCGAVVADCAKKRICDRIAFINSLMASGRFSILRRCELVSEGLACAVWDADASGDKRLDDFTSDIDILDAMEYAVERYMGKF